MSDESVVKHLAKELDKADLLLLKAADALETFGHCKYRLRDDQGRMCLVGALLFAKTGKSHFPDDKFVASSIIRVPFLRIEKSVGEPVSWNNAPERTAEEVIATLRRVAWEG